MTLLSMAGSQPVGSWLLTGVASMNAPKYSLIIMVDVEVDWSPSAYNESSQSSLDDFKMLLVTKIL